MIRIAVRKRPSSALTAAAAGFEVATHSLKPRISPLSSGAVGYLATTCEVRANTKGKEVNELEITRLSL